MNHHTMAGRSLLAVWIRCGIAIMILMAAASNAEAPGFTRSQWADLLRARLPSLVCRGALVCTTMLFSRRVRLRIRRDEWFRYVYATV